MQPKGIVPVTRELDDVSYVPEMPRREEAHDKASVEGADLSRMRDSVVLFVRSLGKLTPLLRKP
jgi:hypothetical protein